MAVIFKTACGWFENVIQSLHAVEKDVARILFKPLYNITRKCLPRRSIIIRHSCTHFSADFESSTNKPDFAQTSNCLQSTRSHISEVGQLKKDEGEDKHGLLALDLHDVVIG